MNNPAPQNCDIVVWFKRRFKGNPFCFSDAFLCTVLQKGETSLFLKRIEMSGFKSFADKTMIRFDEGITGIVGPNGCGKSNVTDAVRWVLGEQSAKSLRTGAGMSDIIFAGSESRKPVNTAKVTLVFDNSQKIFDSPFEEIEITREIRRGSGESACYLNRTPCRLKDISELVMDTGLGRDSLSIITQGNISSFADARPEERRLLFEEAAGVAKYKKRKKASLSRLETVSANLERVQDLIEELAGQLDSLKEQAEKAQEYITCRDELTDLEIYVLARSLEKAKEEQTRLEGELKEALAKQTTKRNELESDEVRIEELRRENFALDQDIMRMQNRQSHLMQEFYQVQKQKTELDEKRKYALSKQESEERIQALKEMAQDAKTEYEQRRRREAELRSEMEKSSEQQAVLSASIAQRQREANDLRQKISNEQSQLLVLQNRMETPSSSWGVQNVLKASRNGTLPGIIGTASQLLVAQEGYEQAISAALAGAADQIACRDEAAARNAIGWLKKTRSGRATFLPLTVCKPRSLQPWQQQIAERSEGILGTAQEFAISDPRLEAMKSRLLGQILVSDNLEAANKAARNLKYSLKIVTTEGDVVHAGGAMSGGSQKSKQTSYAQLKREWEQAKERLQHLQQQDQQLQQTIDQMVSKRRALDEDQVALRIDLEKVRSILQIKKEKFDSLYLELQSLDARAKVEEGPQDSLAARLSELHEESDKLKSRLEASQKKRNALAQEIQTLDGAIRILRKEISRLDSTIREKEVAKARTETRMEQDLERLSSEYSLTYEAAAARTIPSEPARAAARAQVLRRKLTELGDVNLKAPEQYQMSKERHDFLKGQKEELEGAAKEILEAVDEMDQTMKTQFMEMFNKINDNLDGIFKAMFGGGHASLSLSDPNNILETGIEVNVQPPGKAVKSMQTFSGGEKALIAISVLFAILKARTVPLCIFDEVEAALDQANVERFARYLSHFKDQSQFIVVTHRPGTMEKCESLYGITMKKDGVSQVLKVLLKDAMEMTDRANRKEAASLH